MKKHRSSGRIKQKLPRLLLALSMLSLMLVLSACSTQLLQFILGSGSGSTATAATTTAVITQEETIEESEASTANASETGYSSDLNQDAPLFVGTEAFPEFLANNLDGETMDKALFAQSDLTMVNIWGTFCGPCIDEIPALQELSIWAPSVGAQVIGIVGDAYDESIINAAGEILSAQGADYINLVPDDALTEYMSQFQYVPTTVFVNREGMLVGEPIVGSGDLETYQRAILDLLGK